MNKDQPCTRSHDALIERMRSEATWRMHEGGPDSKRTANILLEAATALSAKSETKPMIPPQLPAKPMPYPTKEEIALYRDTFRRELDKRMDTKHPSASPSTEAHEIALRLFVENRNAA